MQFEDAIIELDLESLDLLVGFVGVILFVLIGAVRS
jgi:hypothetical protein